MIAVIKKILISVSVILFASSCEDKLTERPLSYYEKSEFFKSEENAEMGIVGIYNVLPSLYGDNEMAFASSDDTYYVSGTNSDNARRDISHYRLSTTNKYVESVWNDTYKGLERANYMIEGIEQMKGYSKSAVLQSLVAEAKFLRAFFSFNLVKYWGDVPYKTFYTTNYEDTYQPRTSRDEIYNQIVDDLCFAKSHLEWATEADSPERATQGAARALLMRALLFRAGYSLNMNGELTRPDDEIRHEYYNQIVSEWEAFAESNHGFYEGGYEELFKSFSAGKLNTRESIFEVAFYTLDGKTGARGYWGTYNGPYVDAPVIKNTESKKYMGRANALFRVIPEWYDFFDSNDKRRDVMICRYKYEWDKEKYNHVKVSQERSKKNWYPGKWRREWMPVGYRDPNLTDVNYCNIRYADVVLMAAEAYNELGKTTEAWSLINKVRERAEATQINSSNYSDFYKAPKVYDLPFIDDGNEQGRIRTALYWERGFELAFELHRRFDLVRWGILAEAVKLTGDKSVVNASSEKAYIAGDNYEKGKHELFPIPLDEMQINYKLNNINNPKY
ncbi:SusD family [uncultured Bacteroides sp.]|uniref:RagB/SusD family nutrient uptake outer membrane protein n=1 Tax=Bacteroides cellulolyticus TaxID=2981780 RepID=UPI000821A9A5|nr:RagB/SusD family nutrient uptake outer membrane protein [Bacteroides cellulolyticus]MCU6772406.1 RagB/SusD family nutrient uptake outer membrane protein [Bacteroides cellulolyticus]SCI36788.1 SusD family [uncultured Bacteroides sp.]